MPATSFRYTPPATPITRSALRRLVHETPDAFWVVVARMNDPTGVAIDNPSIYRFALESEAAAFQVEEAKLGGAVFMFQGRFFPLVCQAPRVSALGLGTVRPAEQLLELANGIMPQPDEFELLLNPAAADAPDYSGGDAEVEGVEFNDDMPDDEEVS